MIKSIKLLFIVGLSFCLSVSFSFSNADVLPINYDQSSSSHSEMSSSELLSNDSETSESKEVSDSEVYQYSFKFNEILGELMVCKTFTGPYKSEILNQEINDQNQHNQARFKLWELLHAIGDTLY